MKIDRRTLLKGAATTIATAASLQRPLFAANARELTLVDASLGSQELRVAGALPRAGSQTIQPDLVRQWRDGLGRDIALCKCARAYVRWDKALLLADLARESGMKARQRRLDRSVFEVRIDKA
jgi:hypothetical protein